MHGERIDGAEPFSGSNGAAGVLVLHGFTGSTKSMRPLAEAFANAAFSVELPLLAGHGTSIEDLQTKSFADWTEQVDAAYASLEARTDRTLAVGHSMGGSLALWLALNHGDLAGLILINPLVAPPAPAFLQLLDGALAGGSKTIPSIGADVKRSGVETGGYHVTPIAPLRSLLGATTEIAERLGEIVCPTLLFSSRVDHVVPVESSDLVEEKIGGPIERVVLENSFHVAPLDEDAPEIESRSIEFATKLCAA